MAKVLVADDSELDRELTARALRKSGREVEAVLCPDGADALDYFLANPDVDLVLLDHRMPRVGAEEFLTGAPKDRLESTPVVLFSSAVSPSNVDRCLDLGARGYVEKPTDPTEYSAAVRRALDQFLPAEV